MLESCQITLAFAQIGLRLLFASALRQEFQGAKVVYGMRTVFEPTEARVLPAVPEVDVPAASGSHAGAVRRRGALRGCVLPDRLPFAYSNEQGQLTGFDVEMAHRLARDLGARLEFVQTVLNDLPAVLERGGCDLAMSGTPVTPLRASAVVFSEPYLDDTLGWLVRDHLRDRFSTWEAIRTLSSVRVGAQGLAYYLYRGDFLDTDRIYPWTENRREQLRVRYLRALCAWGQHLQQLDRYEEAGLVYRQGLEANPLAEERYCQLMRCLIALDRRAEAALLYRRYCILLQEDLGLQPAPQIRSLYQSLQGQAEEPPGSAPSSMARERRRDMALLS